jgi:5-methylcytosine-specific restriction enzyme subunit McrC
MVVIDLTEYQATNLERGQLTDEEALLLYRDTRFSIEFPTPANGHVYSLTSLGWVGHIPIGETTLVRIASKVPIDNIFGMLEVAYRLKSFRFLEGETEVESLDDIYTSLASVLAQRVLDRARKGTYRAYVQRDENLRTVRGRIDVVRNLPNLIGGKPQIFCQYRELTPDIEDNQLVLWTLFIASRMALARESVRSQVRQAYRTLAGSVSVVSFRPEDCIGRLYQRLNADYEPLHALCRFLLEHGSPAMRAGDRSFLPFQLDMARLFELFVAEWLNANAPPALQVRAQHHVKLKGDGDLSFQIDLCFLDRATGLPFAVLDTKYKASGSPSESDVQQVVAYAVELGAKRAILIYPSTETKLISFKVGPIEVSTATFDLSLNPDVAGEAFLAQLGLGSAAPSL